MRNYIMAGPRGNYEKYIAMKEKVCMEPLDRLYVLGDILDYSNDSFKILEDISTSKNVFLILGDQEIAHRDAYKYRQMYNITQRADFLKLAQKYEDYIIGKFKNGQYYLDMMTGDFGAKYSKILNHAKTDVLIRSNKQNFYIVHSSPVKSTKPTERSKEVDDFYRTTRKIDKSLHYSFETKTPNSLIVSEEKLDDEAMIITGHTLVPLIAPEKTIAEILKNDNFIELNCGCGGKTLSDRYKIKGQRGRLACICLETLEEFYID